MAFKLSVVDETKRDTFYIKIVGDVNDGDYVTENISCDPYVFRNYWLKDLIDLKMNYSRRHEFDKFHEPELIPMGELDNMAHTLVELEVTFIDSEGILYEVTLGEKGRE